MVLLQWVVLNALPIAGFFLAVTLLVHQKRPQRSPSSTVAWLLAILLVPYVGVPAYILFGGRKTKRMIRGKAPLQSDVKPAVQRAASPGVGSIFPVREGNDVSLLLSGEHAYAALLEMIGSARTSIDVATYILSNDLCGKAVVEALAHKARQGVRVRLLLDALGSLGLPRKMLGPLHDAGGHSATFMPMMHLPFRGRANLRNHRKMVIVDDTSAMLGGMNIAAEYMGAMVDGRRWRDLSLIVKGPVLSDVCRVFRSDWRFAARHDAAEEAPIDSGTYGTASLQLVPSGPDVVRDPLYESTLTALFKAQHRVWIVTPYFIPDELLLQALCIAARRGVDVRIVVPRVSNHRLADLARRSYLRQLQDSGATICNFTPGMMHGKVILIDNELGIVGSMNVDMRSFFLNYEVALFVYDKGLVRQLDLWVTGLIDHSDPGIKDSHIAVEFAEGIARLLAPLL